MAAVLNQDVHTLATATTTPPEAKIDDDAAFKLMVDNEFKERMSKIEKQLPKVCVLKPPKGQGWTIFVGALDSDVNCDNIMQKLSHKQLKLGCDCIPTHIDIEYTKNRGKKAKLTFATQEEADSMVTTITVGKTVKLWNSFAENPKVAGPTFHR